MRRWSRLATVTAVVGGVVGVGAGTASAAQTIVVRPGQSIQAAVNRAAPGDTVLVKPGTYHQSVLITKSHIRLRGSGNGPGGTVIVPGNPKANACAKNSSGICVVSFGKERVAGVVVDDLRVHGFKDSGVIAFNAKYLYVTNVVSYDNGGYGIARFKTYGGSLVTNTVWNNDEAGLYVGDSSNAQVFVAGNHAFRNGFGMLYRHSQVAYMAFNDFHDNCVGVMVVAAPPPVGAAVIEHNTVRHNNKTCKGNEEEVPFDYSGGGIVLVGATHVVIRNNALLSNRGSTPLSGGIVLLNGKPFGGPASSANRVISNTAYHDAPADIVDRSGGKNYFAHNHCARSIPAGHC